MTRPNPLLWLWQAMGGKLPQGYSEWVLHDSIVRTWRLRHLLRTLLRLLIPVVLLYLVLDSFQGPAWLAAQSVSIGLIVAVYYSISYAEENTDGRVHRYGYPPKYASHLRTERKQRVLDEARQRYESVWRD